MDSATHLVLIPSYNSGPRLLATVRDALARWSPVWVVLDGSTDGSGAPVEELARSDSRLRLIARPRRGGKGRAVAAGAAAARAAGFTHALVLDADGQHPADKVPEFMAASARHPDALILGRPLFGPDAPLVRVRGRRISAALVRLEVLGSSIADPLFGFRVYPLAPLLRALASTSFGRGYDFDHEMAVRIRWAGAPTLNLDAPCRYWPREQGGISHFRYGRDNAVLFFMNTRLILELLLWRWASLLFRKRPGRLSRALCLAAGISALAPHPAAAAGGESRIENPASDPAWADLLPKLAAMGARRCDFEEHRGFAFRTTPLVLKGRLRFSAERGLSLQYLSPERRIIIVDRQGVVLREQGRNRSVAAGEPSLGPLAALFPVLEFDLGRLPQLFDFRGLRSGRDWTLDLTPRAADLAERLRAVRLSGRGATLTKVRLDLGEGGRIELFLTGLRQDVAFTPAEVARYFR